MLATPAHLQRRSPRHWRRLGLRQISQRQRSQCSRDCSTICSLAQACSRGNTWTTAKQPETRLGYGQQALDAASRLRQQGYQTALGLAGQDVGAQTAAAQFAAQQRASAQAQNLAAQQAAMGMRLNAAQQLAGLGQQAFGTGQAIQQQQMQQGLLQQMLQQSLIDAAKAQYAGYTGAPSAALAAPLAALGATPVPQTTTQTKQPGLFDYLRLGATAYGMS